jgi:MSHA biogenesis protein MshJ
MSEIKQHPFDKLSDRFLSVSMREQILITLCGVVVIVLLVYTFLLEPNISQSAKLTSAILNGKAEQSRLTQKISDTQKQFKNDPNAAIRERIENVNLEILSLDAQLQEQTSNLVPANKMANMLENVLLASKGIKLIELASIAPTPIFLSKPEEGNKKAEADLYRHGVSLSLQGSYFDIQAYLEKLESLQWKFYWKKFDYQVDAYPKGLIELEIYTLSTSKAFLGV